MKKNYLSIFLLFSLTCFSQSSKQLGEVIKNTNITELVKLGKQFNAEFIEREKRITEFLSKNKSIRRTVDNSFSKKEIYDIIDNKIIYYQTSNFNSSKTIRTDRLYSGGSLGLNIQGQGMKAFVWDGGGALTTHVEFPNNKVTIIDAAEIIDHATHVTGTIVAQGITPALRGIAFNASVDSYNWTNDLVEMTNEATKGMLISNHSYVTVASSEWVFGAYNIKARQFDQIAFNAPYYLAVGAAGNDRNKTAEPVFGQQISDKYGYDLVTGMQNSKNMLTVGAVNQVLNYTGPESVTMSNFSNWGPTDDGRIKPEVVAKGVAVRSTVSTSDTANANYNGTSMASPAVAGAALLMQQHYYNSNTAFMKAATLKGLLMHTADEAGVSPGPDYEYGWGLVNAEKAATLITNKATNTAIITELTLNNGATFTRSVTVNGPEPLMVSISWTDRAANANTTGTVDPTTLYLN